MVPCKIGYILEITRANNLTFIEYLYPESATVAIKHHGPYEVQPTNNLTNEDLFTMSQNLRTRALMDRAVFATCFNNNPNCKRQADQRLEDLIRQEKYPEYLKLSPHFHFYFLKKESMPSELEQDLLDLGIAITLDVPNAIIKMFINFQNFYP